MRRDVDRLRDIVEAAEQIAIRVARGRDHFDQDEDTGLALIRLMEIVGEACAGVSDAVRERYPAVPWRDAANLRNRVIHGYFDIDMNVVWLAAEREVPVLAAQVQMVLAEVITHGGAGGDE